VQVCKEAEVAVDYERLFQQLREAHASDTRLNSKGVSSSSSCFPLNVETIATSAVVAALELNASAIVVICFEGTLARAVSKYRPSCPIFCVTSNERTAHRIMLHRGCIPLLVEEDEILNPSAALEKAVAELQAMKVFSPQNGSKLVVMGRFRPGSTTPVLTLV
jgi:pyruvate kinase